VSSCIWRPRARYTPPSGPTQLFNVVSGFYRSRTVLMSVVPDYQPILDDRDDVELVKRTLQRGFRVVIGLYFSFATSDTMESDYTSLITMARWFSSTTGLAEFSLNDGNTYREAYLSGFRGPLPLGGKTVAGIKVEMELTIKRPVTTLPDLLGGTVW